MSAAETPVPGPIGQSCPNDSVASDVVFTFSSADTWGDATRRQMCMTADRLIGTLKTDPRVGSLLAANPYRSWPIRTVRRLVRTEAPFSPGNHNQLLVEPMRLRRQHPRRLAAIEGLYRAYDGRLRRAAEVMGMQRPAIITCNPFVAGFSPLSWAGPVTFYAFDDWAAYPPHRPWWPAYQAAYAGVAQLGRRVCAVSQAIVDRVQPTAEWVIVPNGLAPEEWQGPWQVPPWFDALPRPRLLYVGTLDDRLDAEAVLDAARSFESGSVVLVGPVTDPSAVEPFRNIANLHIGSPVNRAEVAGLVHSSDACLLPHRRTPLTTAMSPLKLYEYLAGGRPVVASDLPPVHAVDDRIVIVPESASFAEGVGRALALGPASEERRQEFIACNSWARRHDTILDLVLRP